MNKYMIIETDYGYNIELNFCELYFCENEGLSVARELKTKVSNFDFIGDQRRVWDFNSSTNYVDPRRMAT